VDPNQIMDSNLVSDLDSDADAWRFSATAERLVFITPSPIGERSIVMSVSLCVSVRDHIIFGTTRPIFTNFFVNVTYGRGSVLLWRRNDMVCTSGFMDDVISQGCWKSQPCAWL